MMNANLTQQSVPVWLGSLGGLERRLESTENRLDKRLDRLDKRQDRFDGRLDKMDDKLFKMEGELKTLNERTEHLATKSWILSSVLGGMGVVAGIAILMARLFIT